MSDEQLWTDEKIENRLDALGFIEHKDVCYIDYGEVADFIEDEVRDEYEAERAKLMQRIDELATTIGERDKLIGHLSRQLAEREAWEVVDTIETEWGYQLACVTEHPDGEITLQTTGYSIADPDQQFSIRMPKQYRICRKQSEASE
jgi:uncharacterized coiled-coil protein SlyX